MGHAIQPTVEADFTFATTEPFQLERGGGLQPVTLHYAIYGDLEKNRDRVILVAHALSGSARVADWWPELFRPDAPFDTERYCYIGVNILGSCYGSTGPKSFNPATKRRYGPDFPLVTIGDIVRSQAQLLDYLQIKKLFAVIGASIGGMQALNWALQYPERVERSIVIGTAPLQALGLGLNHLQRQSIWNDPAFKNGWYEEQPANGLGVARAIAMLSYKSGELFEERFGRKPNRTGNEDPFTTVKGRFDVAGYLDYQQSIFLKRFDANTYITITKLMDTWEVPAEGAPEYRGVAQHGVEIELVGISSDWLFPTADVLRLHQRLTREGILSRYSELNSEHGHDAFLAEPEELFPILREALATRKAPSTAGNVHVHAGAAD
jgi:homoserine O-acetyltransferase/O-succinyltransferase